MAVSLVDVFVSRRPDRSPLQAAGSYATGGLLAAVLLVAVFAGRRPASRR